MFKSVYLPQTPLSLPSCFLPSQLLPAPSISSLFFLLQHTPSLSHFSLDLFSALLAICTESWVAVNMAAFPGASPLLGGLYRVLHGLSPTPGPQDQL